MASMLEEALDVFEIALIKIRDKYIPLEIIKNTLISDLGRKTLLYPQIGPKYMKQWLSVAQASGLGQWNAVTQNFFLNEDNPRIKEIIEKVRKMPK